MKEAIFATLMLSQTDVFEWLGKRRGGFLMLVGAFLAGAGANTVFGEMLSHEPRLDSIEVWQEVHVDSVSSPLLERTQLLVEEVATVEGRVNGLNETLDRIETLLWCMHNDVRPCPAPDPSPPTRR